MSNWFGNAWDDMLALTANLDLKSVTVRSGRLFMHAAVAA